MYEKIGDPEVYLKHLLIGMQLEEFTFAPIRFLLYLSDTFEEKNRPSMLQLAFGDFWWFGEKVEWQNYVRSRGVGVDPECPLLAGELTKLVSASKKTIIDLKLTKNSISIHFDNGVVIHSEYPKDDCDIFFISVSTFNTQKVGGGILFEGLENGDIFIQEGFF